MTNYAVEFYLPAAKNELKRAGARPVAATSDDMELAKQCPNCGKHIHSLNFGIITTPVNVVTISA